MLTPISSRTRELILVTSALIGQRREDVFLASFPRSGSAWLRLFLCHLISLNEWNGRDLNRADVDTTMPRLGRDNMLRPWRHHTIPRVVRTHRCYSPVFSRARSIGIIRDPRDVMVSFYHFRKNRKHLYRGTFGDFLRDRRYGLYAWFKHYTSWRDRWELVLEYEAMTADSHREFSRVLDVLHIDCPDSMVREANTRSSFTVAQKAERQHATNRGEAMHVRSGSAGQWTRYFSERDMEYYGDLATRFELRAAYQ